MKHQVHPLVNCALIVALGIIDADASESAPPLPSVDTLGTVLRGPTAPTVTASTKDVEVAVLLQRLKNGEQVDVQNGFSDDQIVQALAKANQLLTPTVGPDGVEAHKFFKYDPHWNSLVGQLAEAWRAKHSAELDDDHQRENLILTLPIAARMTLGDWLGDKLDSRAVPFYQACYLEWERGHTSVDGSIQKVNGSVPGLHPLAWFYQAKHQWRDAADTYMMSEKYSTSAVWVSDALVEAGRNYYLAGEDAKAEEAYERVKLYKQGWYIGLSNLDRASRLIKSKKYTDAIDLLEIPVKGDGSDQIQLALLSDQARCYYLLNDFSKAKLYANRAISQYLQLTTPLKDQGLASFRSTAEGILTWASRWESEQIVIDPQPESKVTLLPSGKYCYSTEVILRSPSDTHWEIDPENPDLTTTTTSQPQFTGFTWDQRVNISIVTGLKNYKSAFKLRSPNDNRWLIRVPVRVNGDIEPLTLPNTMMKQGDATVAP